MEKSPIYFHPYFGAPRDATKNSVVVLTTMRQQLDQQLQQLLEHSDQHGKEIRQKRREQRHKRLQMGRRITQLEGQTRKCRLCTHRDADMCFLCVQEKSRCSVDIIRIPLQELRQRPPEKNKYDAESMTKLIVKRCAKSSRYKQRGRRRGV